MQKVTLPNIALRTDAVAPAPVQPNPADWQSALAEAVNSPAELCRLLNLPPALVIEAEPAAAGFPLRVPRQFLSRIRPGDPNDPL